MKVKTLRSIRNILQLRKQTLPILECFYIDKEFITLSNLTIWVKIRHHFPIAKYSRDMAIRGDHFLSCMEYIKAPFEINNNENDMVEFTQPDTVTRMRSQSHVDYPGWPTSKEEKELFNLTAYEIQIMNIASAFVADDERRPVMSAVCASKDFIVASDAHMLYYRKIKERFSEDVLFATQVIKIMMLFPLDTYEIKIKGGYLYAEGNDLTIAWRTDKNITLYDSCKYPNWRLVIPESEHFIVLPLKETQECLKKLSFAVNRAARQVIFEIKGQKMTASGKDFDYDIHAEESIDILNPDNNKLRFGMKLDFLQKVLKVLEDEGYYQVKLAFKDETKAFVFEDRLLVMPMMIHE